MGEVGWFPVLGQACKNAGKPFAQKTVHYFMCGYPGASNAFVTGASFAGSHQG